MAYEGFVVKIKDTKEHNNADKLQVIELFGTSVVVGLQTEAGDVMVYFPTDGQLSYEFALEAGLLREDKHGNKLGGYMDPKKRNVKAIKLRGERSDGILVPIHVLEDYAGKKFKVGDTVTKVGDEVICQKYVPVVRNGNSNNGVKSNRNELAKKFPYFERHKDTGQLAYSIPQFKVGDLLTLSLKLHGTSQRTMKAPIEKKKTFLDKILRREPKKEWETVTGTRRVILDGFDGGYHGDNLFRQTWHDLFDMRLRKGETVFYEVVGYVSEDKTIMPKCNNKLLQDKQFVKDYGKETTFDYGLENGENDIYVYRMTMTTEEGHVIEYSTSQIQKRCDEMGVKYAPVLKTMSYTSEEDFMNVVNEYTSGPDPVGKSHLREGIVVRIENRPEFSAFKNKSFEFKVLEGIIKDLATEPDMEESQ